MANNAITRAILKRRPQAAAQPPDPDTQMSEQEKQIEAQTSAILKPYETQQKSALSQRFSNLEQKLFEQELGRGQREADILQRRFAALGGQAGEATEQRAYKLGAREAGRRLDIGQSEIEQERLAQEQALSDLMAERRLGIGERLRGQEFQAEQAQLGRQAQAEEARLAREAAAEQARLGREASAEQARLAREQEAKLAEMDRALQERQIKIAEQELDLNTRISIDNLARANDGFISEDILKSLEEAGLDTSFWREKKRQEYEKEKEMIANRPPQAGTFSIDIPDKNKEVILSEEQIKNLKKPKPIQPTPFGTIAFGNWG